MSKELNSICEVICIKYNITLEKLKAIGKKTEVVEPRQIAMYIAKETTNLKLNQIGRYFNRDHATVLHAHKKIKNFMDVEFKTKVLVNQLMIDCMKKPNINTENIIEVDGRRHITLHGYTEDEVKYFKIINNL